MFVAGRQRGRLLRITVAWQRWRVLRALISLWLVGKERLVEERVGG